MEVALQSSEVLQKSFRAMALLIHEEAEAWHFRERDEAVEEPPRVSED